MATKETYREWLKHPNWQRKRLEILERDNFTCVLCGTSEHTLHVHHWRYIWGRKPWEYAAEDLATLCEECHGMETRSRKKAEELLLQSIRHRRLSFKVVCDIRRVVERIPSSSLTEFDADMLFAGILRPGVIERLIELGIGSGSDTEAAR